MFSVLSPENMFGVVQYGTFKPSGTGHFRIFKYGIVRRVSNNPEIQPEAFPEIGLKIAGPLPQGVVVFEVQIFFLVKPSHELVQVASILRFEIGLPQYGRGVGVILVHKPEFSRIQRLERASVPAKYPTNFYLRANFRKFRQNAQIFLSGNSPRSCFSFLFFGILRGTER